VEVDFLSHASDIDIGLHRRRSIRNEKIKLDAENFKFFLFQTQTTKQQQQLNEIRFCENEA
jgi:hypothetical protein